MKTPIPRLFGLTTMLLLGPAATAATPTTEVNRVAEVGFESAKDCADPFNHVTFDAVFTTPDGRLLRVPAFWAGGKTWRVRYASPLTGTHHYRTECTECSDAANASLPGVAGIQMVAGLSPDMPAFGERGRGDAGQPWEKLYARIRPEYFDAADRRLQHLVEQGLTPWVLGCWGYPLPWLGTEKMKQHWRYCIARWGALPVVWCAAGEPAMPWYNSGSKAAAIQQLRREWNEVIRSLHAIDPFKRLVTTHPRSNARDEILDPTLLDFEMHQTGHGAPTEDHSARALQAWNRPPLLPALSGEARHEALEIGELLGAREAREAFWAHLLHRGCAGHTYGVNGAVSSESRCCAPQSCAFLAQSFGGDRGAAVFPARTIPLPHWSAPRSPYPT